MQEDFKTDVSSELPSPVRKLPEAPKKADPEKIMILVGFGKKDLSELVAMVQAGREEDAMRASSNVPPRWRRLAICDPQDIDNMRIYTEFLSKKLGHKVPGL